MKWAVVIIASLLFGALTASADQIVLKNGDRLSGTIEKADGSTLILKSDYLGEVSIKWSAIDQITSIQPLHVALKDGKTVVGQVSTSGDSIVIATPTTRDVSATRASIVAIRNDTEQTAYDKSLHPGLMMGWNGGINVGFALTRGNSQTTNLALAFTGTRKTSNDRIGVYANSIYATNDAPGATPNTTANALRGGLRYDRDFTVRVFGFGSGDFGTDDLQNLDLRSVLGGGLGFHAIKSEATTLDLLAGLNYTRESYSTFTRSFPAATLGEELLHKWRASTVLTQKLYFYPDLKNTGEYRATFDFGTVTKLSKWLGWQNAFSDIYTSNPPAGKKQNDILLTTGLNISFVH
jgi:putative salt-induced outer membrane protein